MLIEITTNGFVADPVLWQTSTFWPAVFSFVLAELPAFAGFDFALGFDGACELWEPELG
jgi:hypothetical protein